MVSVVMSVKKPTIQDIAHIAGVGPGTVSRVLNRHPNVSDRTRAKVLAVIEKLDYRPSFAARHMRTQRSHLIGFLTDEVATTPYAGQIIFGAQEAAWEQERVLIVVNVGRDARLMDRVIEMFLEREVEGIIYAAMYHVAIDVPKKLRGVPVVLANCAATDGSVPSVIPDEYRGGYTATEYLIHNGHRRIGFINVNTLRPGIPASVGRWQGYKAALEAHGVAYDEELVRYGCGDSDSGYRYAIELLNLTNPPTAIFCGNDRTAFGSYNVLAEAKLRIPQDVAVVGFDNQEIISTALRPSLTTLQLPHYEMGKWAATYLLKHIVDSRPMDPIKQLIECPMVERSSVGMRRQRHD
jgi:LacI family transcriptional regulator